MKLYTEEQVICAMTKCFLGHIDITDYDYELEYNILKNLTPIELPSDEEIEKSINKTIDFIYGAKWMKEQILGKDDKTFKQKSKWTEVDNITRRLK